MSGALVRAGVSLADIAESKEVPALIAANISQAEWDTMPPDERVGAYQFFVAEMAETTNNLDITFPKIKYPTSGTGVFESPTATGEPDYKPTLTGVVIAKQPVRAWWPIDEPIANNPPKCSSPDGVRPLPDSEQKQAEYCMECPQAKFGTGKEGQGQACKARLNVFMLMDHPSEILDEIPTLLSVPPSQLKVFNSFAVQLAKARSANGAGLSLLTQTTVFSLINATNKLGTPYKGLALKLGRPLRYAEMKRAREIGDLFKDQMTKRGFVVEDEDPNDPGIDSTTIVDGTAEIVS